LRYVCAALLAAVTFSSSLAYSPAGEEEPVFTIEFNDGAVAPLRLQVPANKRFQLLLRNNGETPAEFESSELRKEKVLAPKSSAILVFRTLDPGEYPFFDDFHPSAPKAVLVAK
jgi:Cupredoxin-like domain